MTGSSQSEETQMALLRQEVGNLTIAFALHKKAQDDTAILVRALSDNWDRATGTIQIMKWIAMVGGACATIWLAITKITHPGA